MAAENIQQTLRKRKPADKNAEATKKNMKETKNAKKDQKKDAKNLNRNKKTEEKKDTKNVKKETKKQKDNKEQKKKDTKNAKDTQKEKKETKDVKEDKKKNKKAQQDKKKSKEKKNAGKKSSRTPGQIARRREKRQEARKADQTNKTLTTIQQHWLYDYLLQFARDHYIITAVTVISIVFLIGLQLAVHETDDRHPSKHPNITDHVTFSMKVKNGPTGDLVFGLYGDDCPKTVKNFIMLANHDNGYGFEDSRIFAVIPQRMIIGGDIVNNDGSSGRSALGEPFEEENLKIRHKIRGTLGMMNLKNNDDSRLSSQFYITLGDCSNFDGQMVVFGHLLEGLSYLSALERTPVNKETWEPKLRITIVSTKHKVVKS